VPQVPLDGLHRPLEDRPVAGQDGGQPPVRGQVTQPGQGVQVLVQAAVGMGDHGRAPPEDRVTGQHRAVVRQQERQRVVAVPGRADDVDAQPGHGDDVAVPQPFVTEPVPGVERPYRRAGQLGEPPRAFAVIGMTVGEQHLGDRADTFPDGGQDGLQMRLVLRAGIDHDRALGAGRRQHPGVRAVQRHRARIRRQDTEGRGADLTATPGFRRYLRDAVAAHEVIVR
jgi:hypothetical protein